MTCEIQSKFDATCAKAWCTKFCDNEVYAVNLRALNLWDGEDGEEKRNCTFAYILNHGVLVNYAGDVKRVVCMGLDSHSMTWKHVGQKPTLFCVGYLLVL